jgi:mRNA interferase MazF
MDGMNRGNVYWVRFDPAEGGEIKKVRPAIIVSNNISNRILNRVQVVPVTSNTKKVYPGESLFSLNQKNGKALCSQIRTVSKARLGKYIGDLSEADMFNLEHALKIQLGFI